MFYVWTQNKMLVYVQGVQTVKVMRRSVCDGRVVNFIFYSLFLRLLFNPTYHSHFVTLIKPFQNKLSYWIFSKSTACIMTG